jgi:hypothetical protein
MDSHLYDTVCHDTTRHDKIPSNSNTPKGLIALILKIVQS